MFNEQEILDYISNNYVLHTANFYAEYKYKYSEKYNHKIDKDKTVEIKYKINGSILNIYFLKNRNYHTDNHIPSFICYNIDTIEINYHKNKILYREDGPAYIKYNINDNTIKETEWWLESFVGHTYDEFKYAVYSNKDKFPELYNLLLKKEVVNLFN